MRPIERLTDVMFYSSSTDDLLGLFFGYFSIIVYEIQAVYITLFAWNRDMLTFYCCFTHMLSEIMNILLKRILKQPRPDNGAPQGGLFEGRYGMPSQHCHCFAYLITTILLLTFHYYRKHIQPAKKVLVLIISAIGLTLQVQGRFYLGFHTINQCLVGVAFGTLSALVFYVIGLRYFMPVTERLCNLAPLKWFGFRRDLLSQAPYSNTRTTNSNQPKRKKK